MSLDQCYATYKGSVVLVDGNPADAGQCVQWADTVLAHVYGFVTHYGNAIDWWNNPGDLIPDGFVKITDGSIKKGDFVIYDQRVGSPFGHIDVAMADGTRSNYLGADSNWGHNLTVHEVQHNDVYNNYILGSLRLKGGIMPQLSSGDIDKVIKMGLHRQPTAEELGNQNYANNAALLIETIWNNGGENLFLNPPAASNAVILNPGTYKVQ